MASKAIRIGIGADLHRLGPDRPLWLGGIEIEHTSGLIGHSDADVLLHAVTDALLGAAALGDIGTMFPDTDPDNRGRDSAGMLAAAYEEVNKAGWEICNLDCVVSAEKPKLSPYREQIRERIAEILRIAVEQVGIKAKTGEGVGPIGREEAIAAQCVVLIENKT
jgi:2-C-methyl-D-erythritol 2,4-cyclodiphosphate synthase